MCLADDFHVERAGSLPVAETTSSEDGSTTECDTSEVVNITVDPPLFRSQMWKHKTRFRNLLGALYKCAIHYVGGKYFVLDLQYALFDTGVGA